MPCKCLGHAVGGVVLTLHVAQLQLARQDECTDVEELQPDMLGSLEESGGGRDLNG